MNTFVSLQAQTESPKVGGVVVGQVTASCFTDPRGRRRGFDRGTLGFMILAVVWHFWIAVPLAVGAIVLLVATVLGYLNKVTSTRYPRD